MQTIRLIVLCCVLLSTHAIAETAGSVPSDSQQVLYAGMAEDDVLLLLGEPSGELASGARILYTFEGNVRLEFINGRLRRGWGIEVSRHRPTPEALRDLSEAVHHARQRKEALSAARFAEAHPEAAGAIAGPVPRSEPDEPEETKPGNTPKRPRNVARQTLATVASQLTGKATSERKTDSGANASATSTIPAKRVTAAKPDLEESLLDSAPPPIAALETIEASAPKRKHVSAYYSTSTISVAPGFGLAPVYSIGDEKLPARIAPPSDLVQREVVPGAANRGVENSGQNEGVSADLRDSDSALEPDFGGASPALADVPGWMHVGLLFLFKVVFIGIVLRIAFERIGFPILMRDWACLSVGAAFVSILFNYIWESVLQFPPGFYIDTILFTIALAWVIQMTTDVASFSTAFSLALSTALISVFAELLIFNALMLSVSGFLG